MRDSLRAQNRQALDTTRSAVVSACAGSGKTWLLVSRIVRLLLAGVAPSQILAITFTRKAAQEMAVRLREWMRLLATRLPTRRRTADTKRASFVQAHAPTWSTELGAFTGFELGVRNGEPERHGVLGGVVLPWPGPTRNVAWPP